MTLFALLHGGLHDGSCWHGVAVELARHGHRVVAPDLPVDDDSAGALEWARVAIDAIVGARLGAASPDIVEDVVIVAHSLSGLCAPVIATLHPVQRMVFVGGLLPVPGQSFADHLAANPDAIAFPEPQQHGTGPFGLSWEAVREGFYHDCPEALGRKASNNCDVNPLPCSSSPVRSTAGQTRPRTMCSCGMTARSASPGPGAMRSAGSGLASSSWTVATRRFLPDRPN